MPLALDESRIWATDAAALTPLAALATTHLAESGWLQRLVSPFFNQRRRSHSGASVSLGPNLGTTAQPFGLASPAFSPVARFAFQSSFTAAPPSWPGASMVPLIVSPVILP
jgi:hypothetical protein